MIKKLTSVAVVALIAAAPTFSFAQGVAASLSASFGTNTGSAVLDNTPTGTVNAPRSVSIAGAAGGYAVASSVATDASSGAASGAASDANLPPMASVVDNSGVYETSVTFAPSDFDEALAMFCSGLSGELDNTAVTLDASGVINNSAFQTSAGETDADVTNGTVSITCNNNQPQ